MIDVSVNLNDHSYKISIGSGLLRDIGKAITMHSKPTMVAVISNPTIAGHYADTVLESLRSVGLNAELITLPSGERFKTLNTVANVYKALLALRMDRKGIIVALGGGVIGDMAGFAAATYMRGIQFYQVPTTLLAQVDASVGGKTGVDLPQGKNLVGAFHQPSGVIIDIDTLNTLPARELRSGLAEVAKHGIIYDQEFFNYLDAHTDSLLAKCKSSLEYAIQRSVEIKRDVVVQDVREMGLRAILNYGHTIAHAIEVLSGYGKYRHGEALSIGMVTETLLAEREGIAEKGLSDTVADLLLKMRLPVNMDNSLDTDDIIRAIQLDKKTFAGKFRLALPARIGKCIVVDGLSREALAGAIEAHRVWKQ